MTTDTKSVRLFFALPAEGAREFLAPVHGRLKAFRRELKTVSPENYHITLKFLGETGPDVSRQIIEDFKQIEAGMPAQPFVLKGLGAFPNVRRARVIWCGLDMDTAGIRLLQNKVEELSERHGFKKENRPFQPHLTLARVRERVNMPSTLAEYLMASGDTVYGESSFDRVVLFKSDLRREGPLYTPLAEIKFK